MSPRRAGGRGRLLVVGTGPGPGYFTPRARELVCSGEVFVGGEGALSAAPAWGEHVLLAGPLADTIAVVGDRLSAGKDVCVLTSGDPGYFSMLAALERSFPGEAVVEPGVSSVQLLAARVGMPWQDVLHFSAHGRDLAFTPPVDRPFAVLCGGENTPAAVAAYLLAAGVGGQTAVGVDLGRPGERVSVSSLRRAASQEFGSPATVLVVPEAWAQQQGWTMRSRTPVRGRSAGTDPTAVVPTPAGPTPATPPPAGVSRPAAREALVPGIPEEAFVRADGTPLSRWEIRAVLAAVTRPAEHRVIWDVGAGSGGFSVELALLNPLARVVAFERETRSCRVLGANAAAFGARVEVVPGEVPATFADPAAAQAPDLIVVGGSGGRLEDLLDEAAARLAPSGRLVVTAVTLTTAGVASRVLSKSPWVGYGALQLSSARSGTAGIMQGMNPVTLVWADHRPGERRST